MSLKSIAKYKCHSSVRLNKKLKTPKNLSTFSFRYIDESDIEKEIMNLNKSKDF